MIALVAGRQREAAASIVHGAGGSTKQDGSELRDKIPVRFGGPDGIIGDILCGDAGQIRVKRRAAQGYRRLDDADRPIP